MISFDIYVLRSPDFADIKVVMSRIHENQVQVHFNYLAVQ